jgi:hypothetical protein
VSFTFKPYPISLGANGAFRLPTSGEYFRIMSSTGPVDVTVEGVGTMPGMEAGQALKGIPFTGLLLKDASGAPNSVVVLIASSEFQDNRFSGEVDLSPATRLALNVLPGASWSSNLTVAANTPLTIFNAASNPNGAIVWSAEAIDSNAANFVQAFVAKSVAPANVVDGEVVAQSYIASTGASTLFVGLTVQAPRRIAAGLGLFFISSGAGSSLALRNARYTLL